MKHPNVHHPLHILHLCLDEVDATVAGHSLDPHPCLAVHLNQKRKQKQDFHLSPGLPSLLLCYLSVRLGSAFSNWPGMQILQMSNKHKLVLNTKIYTKSLCYESNGTGQYVQLSLWSGKRYLSSPKARFRVKLGELLIFVVTHWDSTGVFGLCRTETLQAAKSISDPNYRREWQLYVGLLF